MGSPETLQKKKKKGLPFSNETVTPVKRQPTEWRGDCSPAIQLMVDECLEYTMNIKKKNLTQLKMINRYVSKEMQMANKHILKSVQPH